MSVVPDDYAFLRVGGRTFTVQEINVPTVDALMANMQDVHDRRVAAQTAALRQEFVREAFTLSNNEINEIVRTAAQNSVSIPNDKAGYPLVSLGNRLCPVRSCVYSPFYYAGTINGWLYHVQRQYNTAFWAKVNEKLGYDLLEQVGQHTAAHNMVIQGTCKKQRVTLYTICGENILCTTYNFHTTGTQYQTQDGSISWDRCCTGTTLAPAYWGLPIDEFNKQINRVNMDSLAHNEARFGRNDVRNVQTLILAFTPEWTVTHIRPQEGWEVARG